MLTENCSDFKWESSVTNELPSRSGSIPFSDKTWARSSRGPKNGLVSCQRIWRWYSNDPTLGWRLLFLLFRELHIPLVWSSGDQSHNIHYRVKPESRHCI